MERKDREQSLRFPFLIWTGGKGVPLPLLECNFMLWPIVKIFGFIVGEKTTEVIAAGPTFFPTGQVLLPPLFLAHVATQSSHTGISCDKPHGCQRFLLSLQLWQSGG